LVEQDRINLVKEFKETQKNNDFIVLTTYCFDPAFFDTYLLHDLTANNPAAEIVILIDGQQYQKTYARFTKETGVTYHLIPVYGMRGFFHPKIFFFLSKVKREMTLYVGSGNITLRGFTNNAELVTKIAGTARELGTTILDAERLLSDLLAGFVQEKKATDIIKESITSLSEIQEASSSDNSSSVLIHNLENPILDQLLARIQGKEFDSIFMLAPFLSSDPEVLDRLTNATAAKDVTLALQPGNHNLANVLPYQKLFAEKNVSFSIKQAEFEERNRDFHSKIIFLSGKDCVLLVGSPNLTKAALIEQAKSGNVECAIYHEGKSLAEILREIKLADPVDLSKLLDVRNIQNDSDFNLLKIYSADFDEISHVVKLKTERLSLPAKIKIIMHDNSTIEREISLDSGEAIISVGSKIPLEIIALCGDKSSQRRIFFDKHHFIKRIARSRVAFSELSERLFMDSSVDFSDLLAMVSSLAFHSLGTDGEETGSPSPKEREKRRIFMPSKLRGFSSSSTLLRNLQEITLWINYRRKGIQETEAAYAGEEDSSPEDPGIPSYPMHLDAEEERTNLILKIVDELDRIILLFASQSIDSKDDSILAGQAVFLNFFLKIFREGVNGEILESLSDKLLTNLEHLKTANCKKENFLRFFATLVTASYCYGYSFPGLYVRGFDCSDLTEKEAYQQVRKYAEENSRLYFNEEQLVLEKFWNIYSAILVHFQSPTTFAQEAMKAAEQVVIEKDPEIVQLLGNILVAFKRSNWSKDGIITNVKRLIGGQEIPQDRLRIIKEFIE
jgi:HKD family nuclease